MNLIRNLFSRMPELLKSIHVIRETVPYDQVSEEKLIKMLGFNWTTRQPPELELEIKRRPEDLKVQLEALQSGNLQLPRSWVNYDDRICRKTDGLSSSLCVNDAEVYDIQRRGAMEHRFIRHDLWLSASMYDAIYSIFLNEWDFARGFVADGEFPYPPEDWQYATLILEDIGIADVASVQRNPATEDRPGMIGDILLTTRRLQSVILWLSSDSSGENPRRECIRLIEKQRWL